MHYLRQGISLIGLETPTFENALSGAIEIYGMFDQSIQEASLERWAPSPALAAQGRGLSALNRYLTSIRDAPNMEPQPIPPAVDPQGILEKLTKKGFVYGEENEVHYYQVYKDKKSNKT